MTAMKTHYSEESFFYFFFIMLHTLYNVENKLEVLDNGYTFIILTDTAEMPIEWERHYDGVSK